MCLGLDSNSLQRDRCNCYWEPKLTRSHGQRQIRSIRFEAQQVIDCQFGYFWPPTFKKASGADKNSFIAIISHMMNFRLGIAASPSARHRGVRCRFSLLSVSVPIDSTEFTELSELFATRLDVHHFLSSSEFDIFISATVRSSIFCHFCCRIKTKQAIQFYALFKYLPFFLFSVW